MKNFFDSAIVISFVTAFLYAISTAHYDGYLGVIGVESDFINRNIHQILYYSLFVVLVPTLTFVVYALLFMFGLMGLSSTYSVVFYFLPIRHVKRIIKLKRVLLDHLNGKNRSRIERSVNMLALKVFPMLLVIFVAIMSLYYAESNGKKDGSKVLSEIASVEVQPHKLISLGVDKPTIYLITCGTNNCAGIDKARNRVVYFKNEFSTIFPTNVTKTSS